MKIEMPKKLIELDKLANVGKASRIHGQSVAESMHPFLENVDVDASVVPSNEVRSWMECGL